MELRVHGVSGTPPEKTLDDPFPEAVAGDDVARFLRSSRVRTSEGRKRLIEAFHWGRFTSGGASRALWLLLIPFALLNLSFFTQLRPSKWATAVLRVLGAVLTSMLVANVTYVMLELVVRQCAAVEGCRGMNTWLHFVDDWPFGAMLLLGGVPSGLVIALLWWFGRQTFLYEQLGANHRWSSTGGLGDYAFWHTTPQTRMLRDANVAIACGVTGLLYGGTLRTQGLSRAPDYAAYMVIGAGLLLLAFALGVVVRQPSMNVGGGLKWISVLYLVVAAGLAAGFLWRTPEDMPLEVPTLSGFEAVWNSHLIIAVTLLLCLWWCGVRAKRSLQGGAQKSGDVAFKPFWKGHGTVVVATVSVVLAAGLSGGLAYRAVDLLAEPVVGDGASGYQITLSTAYLTGAMWGALGIAFLLTVPPLVALMAGQGRVTVVLFLVGSLSAAAAVVLSWTSEYDVLFWSAVGLSTAAYGLAALSFSLTWAHDGVHALVEEDYDKPAATETTTRKIALLWRLAGMKYRYHWAVWVVAAFGGTLLAANGVIAILRVFVPGWRDKEPPWLATWLESEPATDLSEIGSWVVSGLVLALLLIGVRTWKEGRMRTVVGVVWDLIGFWPRVAHPMCPPPYGGRATIELTSRARHLVCAKDVPAVVLSGHSQGSVVCAATILLLRNESRLAADGNRYITKEEAEKTLERLSFVSYGSQLQWAYARMFPQYLGQARLEEVYDALQGSWRNIYRWTDPLGAPVLSWPPNRMTGVEPWNSHENQGRGWLTMGSDNTPGKVQTRPGRWALRLGHDIRLLDPEFIHPEPDEPASPIRGHSGYYEDPIFDKIVADAADEIITRNGGEVGPDPQTGPAPEPGIPGASGAAVAPGGRG
ncbi:hypothetical protein [Saccharothrix variisporea]|uniref:hypothetical protein n=1 Tax=Saccharothrix variisporea TaxID=543527 RepID=UPI0011C3EE93|nr:hypothetical protein [Saccharothrix variisporea]